MMRTIDKGPEPKSLTTHRCTPKSDFDNYSDKDTLRKHLVREQRALCCYCQSRIHPTGHEMKIEHWKSREHYESMQLDYDNLLGACLGGEGRRKKHQHCDSRKGEDEIHFCLTDARNPIQNQIKFRGDGTVYSDNAAIDREINEVLNLNYFLLVSNRKVVLDNIKERIDKGKLNPRLELAKWDGSSDGELPAFSQVVVDYLLKKLRRSPRRNS